MFEARKCRPSPVSYEFRLAIYDTIRRKGEATAERDVEGTYQVRTPTWLFPNPQMGTGYGVLSDHGSVTATTQRKAGVPVEYQVVVLAPILVQDKA